MIKNALKSSTLVAFMLFLSPAMSHANVDLPLSCLEATREALATIADEFVLQRLTPEQKGETKIVVATIGGYQNSRYYAHGTARVEVTSGQFKGQSPGIGAFVTLDRDTSGSGACTVQNVEVNRTYQFKL